ncbi:RDD family protein [Bacillus sp. BRMEA1]|uniref:RDD family protein n=1 Tax=Neobacillus endophyticus TaxID=2738405 RepID=UPI0015676D29|nr:RDD family protein [Neobacillus endophyticus]NRD81026.1 RDD family protein [Neobacillus endophyticus]
MKPAGFWIRFLAHIIDVLIVSFPISIFYLVTDFYFISFDALNYKSDPTAIVPKAHLMLVIDFIIIPLLYLVGSSIYSVFLTSSKYQGTLGKRALGLKVVNEKGEQISKKQAVGRYITTRTGQPIPSGVG